ncbi:MAG: GNAT family N-acetyltransferase [Alphaproteobacteria bacterium]|jgi:RimJ/RimL family protein N-acetyltransferase|nr:GNAT family N-acetyltransferase [Alphaproteobacteria bacterium]
MILEGAEIRLRPFREDDRTALIAALNDWSVAQWLVAPPFPYTDADADWWIDKVASEHEGGEPESFAVAAVSDDALLGAMSVENELGYWLKPDAWGRGVATRAAAMLVSYGVGTLARTRILARTDPENHASARVLAKVGFRCLGPLSTAE